MIDLLSRPLKVFISGSSKLKTLSEPMKACLDYYMQLNASFIVGDCYGADELAQLYIKSKGYEDVTVYCSTETPRAKRTHFPKFKSLWAESQGKTGEDFYQVKDAAMTSDCDEAVAFWNGISYGVKCNIDRCHAMHKPIKVFYSINVETLDEEGLNTLQQYSNWIRTNGIPIVDYPSKLSKD